MVGASDWELQMYLFSGGEVSRGKLRTILLGMEILKGKGIVNCGCGVRVDHTKKDVRFWWRTQRSGPNHRSFSQDTPYFIT